MEDRSLSRKEIYHVMNIMETTQLPVLTEDPNDDDFEDITAEIFDVVDNKLGDMELICSGEFNFEETMTSSELMDPKMDLRFLRHNVHETLKSEAYQFISSG